MSNHIRRQTAMSGNENNDLLSHTFTVMGERLEVHTNDERILEACEHSFGRFKYRPLTESDMPLRLQIIVDTAVTTPQPYPSPRYMLNGHLFQAIMDADNHLVIDLNEAVTYARIGDTIAADEAYLRYTFIELATLSMLGGSRDFVSIHAACVSKNGVNLMLFGESGMGKSSLAYACLQRGYSLLTEDSIQVKLTSEGYCLWGMPWRLHLMPDTVRFFPEVASIETQLQVTGKIKRAIDVEELFPNSTLTHVEDAHLIVLARDQGQAGTIELLTPEEVLEAFVITWSFGKAWQPWYEHQLAHLVQNGAYRLHLADTPQASAIILDKLVNQIESDRQATS